VRGPRQHRRAARVDDEPEHTDDEDAQRVDRLRILEPAHCLDGDCARTDEEQHAVGLGGDDLRATEAVGVARRCGTTRDHERAERDRQREHVGDHVDAVCEQRERVEHDAADDLDDEEHAVRDERHDEREATPFVQAVLRV
jgi:hypothetical protein